ncbi:actin [Phytophthora infestans]|uniref:Actin n=1 Tax=Phytophthora infestans TaxID=4787 RepID=A0A833SNS5_PHYIN|nr:actin [Phytophthora infestans]
MKVVALDAGGATLKASVVAPGVTPTASILPNHVASTSANPSAVYMGQKLQELEHQRAKLRYLRPVQRGYCVNWNVESELWAHLMSSEMLKVDPSEHALVVTAPLLAPAVVNESMDQVVFEELGFQSYARVSAAESCVLSYSEHCEREYQASLVANKMPEIKSPGRKRQKITKRSEPPTSPAVVDEEDPLRFSTSSCHLVVDSGLSFTHVVPVIDGKVYLPGVRRINVGGKLLTNYLKEIVSYRQWNVMDDTPVINELKEVLCFCSMEFESDIKRTLQEDEMEEDVETQTDEQQSVRQNDDEQALEMGVEMVAVPEVLFHPSDIGINQAGIAETIVQAFKNFRQRLERDLRSLVPDDFDIGLHEPSDPVLAAWQGCCSLAGSSALSERLVSRQEYEEHGSNICLKRF